jgi:hypothetical protein
MNRWLPAILRIFLTTLIAVFLVTMGLCAWEGLRNYSAEENTGSETVFLRTAPSLFAPGHNPATSPFLNLDGKYILRNGKIEEIRHEFLDLLFTMDRVRLETAGVQDLPGGVIENIQAGRISIAVVTPYLVGELASKGGIQAISEIELLRAKALPEVSGVFRVTGNQNAIPIGWGELSLAIERGYAARSGLDVALAKMGEAIDVRTLITSIGKSASNDARKKIASALSESPYILATALAACESEDAKKELLVFVSANRDAANSDIGKEICLTYSDVVKTAGYHSLKITYRGKGIREAFGLAYISKNVSATSKRLMTALVDASKSKHDLRIKTVSEPFQEGFSISDLGFAAEVQRACGFAARGNKSLDTLFLDEAGK